MEWILPKTTYYISQGIFFGIFVNSPHVVHSINNDAMVHGIVMEAFERSLPQSKNNLLKLITPEDHFCEIHSINAYFERMQSIWK